jgi:hypothetical protein
MGARTPTEAIWSPYGGFVARAESGTPGAAIGPDLRRQWLQKQVEK